TLPDYGNEYLQNLSELKVADKTTTELLEKHVNPLLQTIQHAKITNEVKLSLSAYVQEVVTAHLHGAPTIFEQAMKEAGQHVANIVEFSVAQKALIDISEASDLAKPYLHRVVDRAIDDALKNKSSDTLQATIIDKALQNFEKHATLLEPLVQKRKEIAKLS